MAALRAWRLRHALFQEECKQVVPVGRLGWVFTGYLVAVIAVSAIAYFLDESRAGLYPWIMVVGSIPVAGVAWFLSRHYFGTSFHSGDRSGVGVVGADRRSLANSALLGLLLASVATGLSLRIPAEVSIEDSALAPMLVNGQALKTVWLLSAVIVAPLTEELLFRGVLLGSLCRRWSFLVSSTISTLAFLAIHLPQLHGYLVAIVSISALGFAAAIARLATRSIWGSIALHATYNLTLAIWGALLD